MLQLRTERRASWVFILVLIAGFLCPVLGQGQSFIRGDCNADGAFDIADPVSMLAILFQNAGDPPCQDACDCNDDGSLDIGDAICMLSGLFGDPAIPPVAPHPDCGPDPTPDSLGCDMFDLCGSPPVASILAAPLTGTVPIEVNFDGSGSTDEGGAIVSYDWDFGDGATASGIFVSHTYTTVGNFTVTLTVTDNDMEIGTATETVSTTAIGPPVLIDTTSPVNGEDGVAVTRETIIRFSSPIMASSVTSNAIFAEFSGTPLPALVYVDPDLALVDTVTLFYQSPLPGSSIITVFVDGDLLLDSLGRSIDADEDGLEGGLGSFQFGTLSLTLLQNTAVCGRVFASEFDAMVGGQPLNTPLEGVTITIDGIDPGTVSAVTDELGSFRLEPVPAGTFFVHVDGRTVSSALIEGVTTPTMFPGGPYYPFVGKPFTSTAGTEVQLADIFLPLVEAGTLVAVSETDDTQICFPQSVIDEFPELDGVCITVPAGSLHADDGTPGGMVGISPVDPARLPGPLPSGLEFGIVITVQTDGATNFNTPAPICFPNLPDPATGMPLAPGEETALWSFDHDTGEWEVVGGMTVSADGTQICTDPGVGILAPGWHGFNPGVPIDGGDITDPDYDPRNDPNAEGQEPNSDDGDADAACNQGRKVYLHNGEENFERIDLVIPGRGDISFIMRRRYRSQLDINGPLGHGWDFDYNDAIFVQGNGDLKRCNGRGRVVLWAKDAFGNFLPPFGYYRSMRRDPTGLITMRSPDGYKRLYHSDGRLYAHEDRHGNRMVFEYDRHGNLDIVVDPYGREIRFFHTLQSDGVRRLTRIRDFMGREVRYFYDSNGDLVRVRTPVVTGTSTGNNFPSGREEVYTYSSGFAEPELNHNILSVKLPEEVENGGPVAISWDYGTDPGDPVTFDKVIAEHLGGGAVNSSGVPAGGTITFDYELLNQTEPMGQFDLPRGKVLVTERNGNQYEYFVNELAHHIITRRLTRGLRPGEPVFFETRYFYDADGQLLREVEPEGNEMQFVYDTSGSRAQQKNTLEIRRIADAARGGGEDQITTMTYEPLFNRLLTKTGARGNAMSFTPPIGTATPERYTLKRFYDYQEGSAQDILDLAEELEVDLDPDGAGPATALDVAQDLSLDMDLNDDNVTNQTAGNVVRIEAPTIQLLDETGVVVSQPVLTENQWNQFGLLTKSIDPEGNVTSFEYRPINNPNGFRSYFSLLVSLPTGLTGGYQAAVVVDSEDSYRRTSTIPPVALRTEYTYDPVGNMTAMKNPRGVVTTTEYNALNEAVVITRGADITSAVSDGQLITGEAPFAYQVRHFYDHNGRVIRSEVENRDDNTPGVGAFVETSREYDILDNMVSKSVEVDSTTTLTWQYRYDESELRTSVVEPEGNEVRTEYDERNLSFRVTRGFGSPDASVFQYDYDLNGNLAREIDAEDNDGNGQPEVTQHFYDGFDRTIRRLDALGNELLYEYDVAWNITRKLRMGHPPGNPSGANVLLEESLFYHDEHNRRYQVDESLFLSSGYSTVQPVTLDDQNSDGFVTSRTVSDALSRVRFLIEDDLQVSEFTYDGASRQIAVIDALGNEQLREYDNNSNVVRETTIEVSAEGLVPAETYVSMSVYDQLDRLVRTTDNSGQTTRFAYDSRDNRVSMTDAQGPSLVDPLGLYPAPGQFGEINGPGNVTRYFHDGLDRVRSTEFELREGGEGDGVLDVTNPSNPDGVVRMTFDYDGNSRLVGRVDDSDNVTTFDYDALNRMTLQVNDDGTAFEYFYDQDDNVVQMSDPNGTVTDRSYDAINRVTQVDVTRAPGVLGTTQETFEYDGMSRKTRAVDNNGGDPQITEFVHDSRNRLIEERQNGEAFGSTFSGDGKLLTTRYPGGRVVNRTFDSIDRVKVCSDQTGSISEHFWIGPRQRALRRVSGDGTEESYLDAAGTSVGYDAVKRVVQHRQLLPSTASFLDREYDYNRVSYRTSEVRHDDFGLTDTYVYDSLYRIVATDFDQNGLPGGSPRDLLSRVYQLDGVGNRITVDETATSSGAGTSSYSLNSMNEYTSIDGIGRSYDDNGNLLDDGNLTYAYDYKDRLVRVEDAGSNLVAEYRYYSGGRRAEKILYSDIVPGQVDRRLRFLYDRQQLCEEQNPVTGNTEASYVWDPRHIDCLIQMTRTADHPLGPGSLFVHQNVRYDAVAVTEGGVVVETTRYDDYGVPEQVSSVGNPYLFQGRRFDEETGLYYFRNRYYDPGIGRFLQRDGVWDPTNLGNQYTFVGSSPASRFDPLGLNTRGRLEELRRKQLRQLHDNINEIRSSWEYQVFGVGSDALEQAKRDLEFHFKQDTSWVDQGYDAGHGVGAELSGWADVDNGGTYTAAMWEDGNYFAAAIGALATTAMVVDALSDAIPGAGQGKKLAKEAIKEGAEFGIEQALKKGDNVAGGVGDAFGAGRKVDPTPPDVPNAGQFRDSNGRLREANGRFAPDGGPTKKPSNSTHGNTRTGDVDATLYGKFDKDGNFQKWGISQDAQKRYTSKELDGGEIREYRRGPRDQMLDRERRLTERFPGPENRESWAGRKNPNHPNYRGN